MDGIGSISGSMLGTVGLEVASSVNTEFSWKTVTKGKRSRKLVKRLNGCQKLAHKSPKRVGDFSGSDSDKVYIIIFIYFFFLRIFFVANHTTG